VSTIVGVEFQELLTAYKGNGLTDIQIQRLDLLTPEQVAEWKRVSAEKAARRAGAAQAWAESEEPDAEPRRKEIWVKDKVTGKPKRKKAPLLPWDYSPNPNAVTDDLAWRDGEQLSDRAYRMFGAICAHLWVDRRNKDFGVCCTFDELMRWSGRVKSSVQLSLEELVTRGHIKVTHKGKGNYRILILDRRDDT
jgi:hypothetical protein